MQEYRRKSKQDAGLLKVYLNDYDDYIILNANDVTFEEKFSRFMSFIEKKGRELEEKSKEYSEKYEGRPIISKDDDGEATVDTEQLSLLVELKISTYKACCDSIDDLFGEGTVRKYFREFYEINPDFVPDIECINDFLDEIAQPINIVYGVRADKISKKYSKSRKGKHSKTKDELLLEMKEKKAADVIE